MGRIITSKSFYGKCLNEDWAVGGFIGYDMEIMQASARAAHKVKAPVMLQASCRVIDYSGAEMLRKMAEAVADELDSDVVLHLDHGDTVERCLHCIDNGFTSVMLDASLLPFEDNIAATKRVVETAKEYGACVEAELGVVGGNEGGGKGHEIQCTDPASADEFCKKTGIDALAVAIGNAHGNYPVAPELRLDVLNEIRRNCDTPLVLHGGTGITPEDFQECIKNGVRKINIATASFDAAANAAKSVTATDKPNFFKTSAAMADAVYENVKKHIKIFNMENLK